MGAVDKLSRNMRILMYKGTRKGSMKKKRLFVEVDEEFHKKIKIRAIEKNITLRRWILRAIIQQIKQEEQYE